MWSDINNLPQHPTRPLRSQSSMGEEAAVRQWFQESFRGDRCGGLADVFIERGYDRMDALCEIDRVVLDKMAIPKMEQKPAYKQEFMKAVRKLNQPSPPTYPDSKITDQPTAPPTEAPPGTSCLNLVVLYVYDVDRLICAIPSL